MTIPPTADPMPPSTNVRVMIVDDHPLVRAAVARAVMAAGFEMVAESPTAEDALVVAPRIAPDVLLIDIALPGMSGVQLVRELAPRLTGTKIVMLTVSAADRDVLDAIRYGATGYLTKDVSPDALARSIQAAVAGELVMPRRLAARLIERLVRRVPREAEPESGQVEQLSRREQDVLRLLAEGLSDREIATALTISSRTVESHVSSVLHKLDVRNRAQAAERYRATSD